MTNFHNFYSTRYFICTFSQVNFTNYPKPVNLNSFSAGEVVSLVSPNFSKFKGLISYKIKPSSNIPLSLLSPFTKIVVPISYFSSNFSCDFSWFLLFKAFSISSRVRIQAPWGKAVVLIFFRLKFTFFYSLFPSGSLELYNVLKIYDGDSFTVGQAWP